MGAGRRHVRAQQPWKWLAYGFVWVHLFSARTRNSPFSLAMHDESSIDQKAKLATGQLEQMLTCALHARSLSSNLATLRRSQRSY